MCYYTMKSGEKKLTLVEISRAGSMEGWIARLVNAYLRKTGFSLLQRPRRLKRVIGLVRIVCAGPI